VTLVRAAELRGVPAVDAGDFPLGGGELVHSVLVSAGGGALQIGGEHVGVRRQPFGRLSELGEELGPPLFQRTALGLVVSDAAVGLLFEAGALVGPALAAVGPALAVFGHAVADFGLVLPFVGIVLTPVGHKVAFLGGGLALLSDAVPALGANFTVVGPAIPGVGGSLTLVGPAVPGVGGNFTLAGPAVEGVGGDFTLVGHTIPGVGPALPGVGGNFTLVGHTAAFAGEEHPLPIPQGHLPLREHPLPFIGEAITLIGAAVPLVGDAVPFPCRQFRLLEPAPPLVRSGALGSAVVTLTGPESLAPLRGRAGRVRFHGIIVPRQESAVEQCADGKTGPRRGFPARARGPHVRRERRSSSTFRRATSSAAR